MMLNKSALIAGALAFFAALGGVSIDMPPVAEAVSADFSDRYWKQEAQKNIIEAGWHEDGVDMTVEEAKEKFEVNKNSLFYKNILNEVYTQTGAKKVFEKNGWSPLF